MTHTIVLAGAPESNTLVWDEKALLPVQHIEQSSGTDSPSQPELPKWRRLEMESLRMRPILPKLDIDPPQKEVDTGPAQFFNLTELCSQELGQESVGSDISAEDSRPSQESHEPESEAHAEFYNHSFSIHQAIPSSQIDQSGVTPETPVYESSSEMFPDMASTPGCMVRSPSQRRLSQAPRPKNLTSLGDIPNASYLDSIHPQTKTVNLIVGLKSISPPRVVECGAKKRETELVEMVVGDDTKTDFCITMWLPREMHVNWKDGAQEKPEGSRSQLRRGLKFVRPRDVLLIQNVALSTFRGKVHGQSLRGDVTKIDIMFRKKEGDDDLPGVYSVQNLRMATTKDHQILKVKRVRDWLLESVGEGPGRKRKGGSRMVPPDS